MKKTLLTILCSCLVALSFGQTELEKVKSTLSKNTIKGHIYFLASDELKGRKTGSPEIDIAAEYLATSFRKYGVQPVEGATDDYFQMVPFDKVSAVSEMQIKLNDTESSDLVAIGPSNINFEGEAVFVNYGLEEDYKKKDVAGKLVVALAGSAAANDVRSAFSKIGDKTTLAMKNGAMGLVELVNADAQTWGYLKHNFNESSLKIAKKTKEAEKPFAHAWLADDGQLAESLEKGKINASFRIAGIKKELVFSKNVVGMVEGTDPELKDEFVIYSAHYDHIGIGKPNAEGDSIYNGARDNAVGTVTVMSAAENIAKYPTKRSALFILFTAEEEGLLGSRYYVENPLIPLDQMVYCFNSDNGGYNDKTKVSIIGLPRTTAQQDIVEAATAFDLEAIDDPAKEQGLFDRSDNVHFAAKGIPAPTFSLGFTAFDAEIMKYYHQAADNPETIDYDYMEKFFGAYVMSCRLIANNPETPFWTEGDKYYEAGKALYGR